MTNQHGIGVCGVSELNDCLRGEAKSLISIWSQEDKDEARFRAVIDRHLSAAAVHFSYFDDIAEERPRRRLVTRGDIQEILEFARLAEPPLLVHCHAGISRSTAITLAILSDRLGPGREEEALQILVSLRPQAVPNRMIVALADSLLSRRGAMLAAYDQWIQRYLVSFTPPPP